MVKIVMRICCFVLLLLGTAASAADANNGSVVVQGSIISPPLASTGTVLIKTLGGGILPLSEPTPVDDAKIAFEETKEAAIRANDEAAVAADKATKSNSAEDKAAADKAKAVADKAKEEHQVAADALAKTEKTAADDKKANRRFVSLSLRKGDLVEASYTTEPDPSQPGAVRDRLTQAIKKMGATLTGTVEEVAGDMAWIVVRTQHTPEAANKEQNVAIQTPEALQSVVKNMEAGDGVNVTYLEKANNTRIAQTLEWQNKPVKLWKRWAAVLGGALFLYLLAYVFTDKNPKALIIGQDDRYSTSKFQTILWFWLVISAYIAIVAHRMLNSDWTYVGGVDIPLNLLALSGLSVITFTAAKFITLGKVDRAAEQGQEIKQKSLTGPKLNDLIRNDQGELDLGDYQLMVITLLAIVVYAFSVVEFMDSIQFRRKVTMPDVDVTLLAIFGLGQLAYLGKKAAGEGLSPEEIGYVSKAATTAAAAAKAEADNAEKAASAVAAKAKEAQSAADAAARATNKAGAEPEATKAANAAKEALNSAQQASSAARATVEKVTELDRLKTGWPRHPEIATIAKSAETARAQDMARADKAAKAADAKATEAQAAADLAQQKLAEKPA
jgi:hypothetical protein